VKIWGRDLFAAKMLDSSFLCGNMGKQNDEEQRVYHFDIMFYYDVHTQTVRVFTTKANNHSLSLSHSAKKD